MNLPPITQFFNQLIGEWGNDFGFSTTATGPGGGAPGEGYPIYSPVAGIFAAEQKGKSAWGNRGIVQAGPGQLSFAVGHLLSFAAIPGQQVKVNDLIGYSGGATTDPNSGNTTGPHVEVQFFKGAASAAASYLDPQQLPGIQQLEGIIFGTAAAGGKVATGAAANVGKAATPLDPITALTRALSGFNTWVDKTLWLLLGMALIGLGLIFLVFGDLESAAKEAAGAIAEHPEVLAA